MRALWFLAIAACSSAQPSIRPEPPVGWASAIPCACGTRAECERKCDGGKSPSECASLSGCLLAGSVEVQIDVDAGRKFAALACEHDDVLGCKNLGETYLMSKDIDGAQVAWEKAFRLGTRACDAGQRSGCYLAGVLAGDGKGTARDEARAAELMARACMLGHAYACVR